jgi:hypothetical protein
MCDRLLRYFVLSRENVEISGEARKSLITLIAEQLHRLERAKGRFSRALMDSKRDSLERMGNGQWLVAY